jgi:cystathionine beta-lyase
MKGIVPPVNLFSYEATMAAYRYGDPWLKSLINYLKGNRDILVNRLAKIDGLSVHSPEATYLAWVDCSKLNLISPARFFIEAGVGVADGSEFGDKNFIRINFACPRSLLIEALDRIDKSLS